MTYNRWTIRKAKGMGGIFGRSVKVFSLPLGWKSVCPPRTVFLLMVRGEIFTWKFFGGAFASPQPPIFFSNGDIPKLKQLLKITEGWLKVNGLEKSNLKAAKIGHILDRMMIARMIAVVS